jgi:glycine/D-amino acid oxidase-like deaminating enzyme
MERSVDYMGELVQANAIDCDWERNGLLVVATNPKHLRRLQKEAATWKKLGVEGIRLLDQEETRARVNSPYYLGAKFEERCAILNPARFAWGMKKACEGLGVRMYENSPAEEIRWKKGIRVKTDRGSVRADKLVLATNAFHLPQKLLRRKSVPVYTYIVLTEPLAPEQLEPIGWKGREGIEDARNLVHYYRLTADNRLLMGGGDVRYFYGSRTVPGQDAHEPTFDELERFVRTLFPSLADVEIAHRWGGPVSATLDLVPAMGYVGRNRNVVFSLGPVGHGVAYTQLAGSVLKDLVLEQDGEFTDVFFVNRFTTPVPPEPLRTAVARGIIGGMRIHDRRSERKVFKKGSRRQGAD